MSTQPSPITPAESPHQVREAPVSPQEAARFLHIHPKTVLRKAREGAIPAHPVGGDRKRWHFYLSELDDWLRSKQPQRRNGLQRPAASLATTIQKP